MHDIIWQTAGAAIVVLFGIGFASWLALLAWHFIDENDSPEWWWGMAPLWVPKNKTPIDFNRILDIGYEPNHWTWPFSLLMPPAIAALAVFVIDFPLAATILTALIASLFAARFARRLQKKLSKLWSRLDTHIADRNAHK